MKFAIVTDLVFRVLLLLTCLAVASCASTEPSASPRAWSASSVVSGIRVDLWVDRLEIRRAERVNALVRVTNQGATAPTWEQNLCEFGPARVEIGALDGPGGIGEEWSGLAGEFKQMVLGTQAPIANAGSDLGTFRNVLLFDTPMECPAQSQPGPFKPGELSEMQLAWEPEANTTAGGYAGPAAVKATFNSSAGSVSAEALVTILSGDGTETTLAALVGLALHEPAFQEWLNAEPRSTWADTKVSYWPNAQGQYPPDSIYDGVTNSVVEIGLVRLVGDRPDSAAVVLDLDTGRVVGTVFGE